MGKLFKILDSIPIRYNETIETDLYHYVFYRLIPVVKWKGLSKIVGFYEENWSRDCVFVLTHVSHIANRFPIPSCLWLISGVALQDYSNKFNTNVDQSWNILGSNVSRPKSVDLCMNFKCFLNYSWKSFYPEKLSCRLILRSSSLTHLTKKGISKIL